jgi:hypothetical protein
MTAIQVTHRLGRNSGGEFNLESDTAYLEVHKGNEEFFSISEFSAIGRMVINAGMIQAQIPAVATFQVEDLTEVWIRVIAIDIAGNRSQPSESAAVTAELIDDAHISNLTVSKITAGTMTAAWVVAGRIATALSGQRAEMNEDGFFAYDGAGDEVVEINAVTGDIKIVGRIQTAIDGAGITIIPGGSARIEMKPSAGDDHYIRVYSNYFNVSEVQGDMSVRRVSDNAVDGGKVLVWEDGAVLSHQPNVGDETYIGVGWPVTGGLHFQGHFQDGFAALSADDGLYVGRMSYSAQTNVALAWGPTMSSNVGVVASLKDVNFRGNQITDVSTTLFRFQTSAASTAGSFVSFWMWRT